VTASANGRGVDRYLLDRGFSQETIARAGWRVEPLGSRYGRYGLPAEASAAHVLLIPYPHENGRVAFERIRFVHDVDLERFGVGKYRQPARVPPRLYDPFGALTAEGPIDAAALIEGEANTVAFHELSLELPVVGLPGQRTLSHELAHALGHIPVVFVWIDREDPGADRNAARIASRLLDAGVIEVRFLPVSDDANDVLRLFGLERARQRVAELIDQAAPIAADATGTDVGWPGQIGVEALHGLAGEVVATILPQLEADPAALLVQFLVAFGSAVGRGPGFKAESDHHSVNEYALIVGKTSKARKGTSWGHIDRLMQAVDEPWSRGRIQSGLSSGEG
jgi:hypothetical protein